jgi:hypothetical protein
MVTDRNQANGREPSYFNFLMTSRRSRRAAVRFARTGIRLDRVRDFGVMSATLHRGI